MVYQWDIIDPQQIFVIVIYTITGRRQEFLPRIKQGLLFISKQKSNEHFKTAFGSALQKRFSPCLDPKIEGVAVYYAGESCLVLLAALCAIT